MVCPSGGTRLTVTAPCPALHRPVRVLRQTTSTTGTAMISSCEVRRRLIYSLRAASLCLSLAVAGWWVRGLYVGDRFRFTTSRHHWLVQAVAGRVHVVRYRFDDPAVLEDYRR